MFDGSSYNKYPVGDLEGAPLSEEQEKKLLLDLLEIDESSADSTPEIEDVRQAVGLRIALHLISEEKITELENTLISQVQKSLTAAKKASFPGLEILCEDLYA